MNTVIRPLDIDGLRDQFRTARPFPFFKIDNFLQPEVVEAVERAYPSYETARSMGKEFAAVNERLKVQVTDSARFPAPVKELADALSGPEFLGALEKITGIPSLLADEKLDGGGMHLTGAGGRLDVHVDFNFIENRSLHRRLNILLYLNPEWHESWGGNIELWDEDVRNCVHAFQPILNRCVVFETNEISYHGVSPNKCPQGRVRKSFAAYYYTREAPENWDGQSHSTMFRARPDEMVRRNVLMPAERAMRTWKRRVSQIKQTVRTIFGVRPD